MKVIYAAPQQRRGRPVVWTIIATSLALVVLNLTASRASAYCIMDDGTACNVHKAARWANAKYHEGKLGHGHFRWTYFKNPVQARHMLIRKVRHRLAKGAVPSRMAGMTPAQIVHRAVLNTDCVGDTSYAPYTTGFNVCSMRPPSESTKETASKVGTFLFCAGDVYFAYQTVGLTSPFLAFSASRCGFVAWQLW
jgi:hypothetical protein